MVYIIYLSVIIMYQFYIVPKNDLGIVFLGSVAKNHDIEAKI